eukprot:CAMPEP_0171952642 /NCGR_PEP_ID=MMETSP0993-20121228/91905_1 /TAXON_ID=483369 /ORGANISM="non described non described, Strain CCMP2098" /LENGTH=61 /DNA_ID=CAMNT_0012598121 /DNA_START=38 /DNA_END=223 /DNA_ORIENTATION=+
MSDTALVCCCICCKAVICCSIILSARSDAILEVSSECFLVTRSSNCSSFTSITCSSALILS